MLNVESQDLILILIQLCVCSVIMYIVLTLQFKDLGSLNWSQVMENTCII